ncbi:MAG: hypothetical protein V2A53_03605 [bacterium]
MSIVLGKSLYISCSLELMRAYAITKLGLDEDRLLTIGEKRRVNDRAIWDIYDSPCGS